MAVKVRYNRISNLVSKIVVALVIIIAIATISSSAPLIFQDGALSAEQLNIGMTG